MYHFLNHSSIIRSKTLLKIQQCLMEVTTGYVWLILLLDFQQQNMLHIFSSAMVGAMQNGVIKRKNW